MRMKNLFPKAPVFLILALVLAGARTARAGGYERLLKIESEKLKLEALAQMEESRNTEGIDELVTDPEPLIRLRCAEVLGRVNDEEDVVRFLPGLAEDRDREVAEASIFYIGITGRKKFAPFLKDFLKSCSKQLKILAIEAVGRIGPDEGIEILAPFLNNFHSSVRSAAAMAMSGLEAAQARESLLKALHDPDAKVVSRAIYSMGRLECDGVDGDIIPFIFHDDREIRLRTAEALGRLKSKNAIPAVATLLRSRDRMLKIKAAEALVRIGDGDCVDHLAPLLRSDDSYLRALALDGINAAADDDSYELAEGLLTDDSEMVRVSAIRALASTDIESSRTTLYSFIKDGSRGERMTAAEQLGMTGEKEDLEYLVRILLSDEDILLREGAAAGLGRWEDTDQLREDLSINGRTATPLKALIEAADGDDAVIAAIAAESIAKAGLSEAAGRLVEIYERHDGRMDCERKLAILGAFEMLGDDIDKEETGEDLARVLTAAVKGPDPRIRAKAATVAERLDIDTGDELSDSQHWDRGRQPFPQPALPSGLGEIIIKTPRGDIEIELYGDEAPNIVRSLKYLAERGFYRGLTFHRVVPGFVIQGGCPRGDGWGDAGYFLRSQFNTRPYERGVVGMAHAGKDTAGSQFFITHTPQPHLTGRYTVIGRVVRGMEVVDRIERGDSFDVELLK